MPEGPCYGGAVLIRHRDAVPIVHADAVVSPAATLVGDVHVAAGARILPGAVLSAEDGRVDIGENTVVMENAVVRGRAGYPARIGSSVMVGPNAHVNGSDVADGAFIATGAALFPGSRIGAGAEVRIHGVVQVNTTIEPGVVVPIGWVAVGSPAAILPPDRHDEIWAIQKGLDFVGTVYGGGTDMADIMLRQSEFYGAHRADEVVGD